MSEPGPKEPKGVPFLPSQSRRRPVKVSQETLTRSEPAVPGRSLPLAFQPSLGGVRLSSWATARREALEADLAKHGALLFRGFSACSVGELEELIAALSGELLEYTNRSTPRSRVSGRIFTSTEYPPEQSIPLHNEMAYTRSWPTRLFFYCMQAPPDRGETPIADSRKVFQRIDPAVRERFMRHGVKYVRNYSDRLDLPWQEVFQTSERSEVEAYCREAGISFEWKADGRLRTEDVCQAALTHPRTGEPVWFNQAHLFHYTNLPQEARDSLLAAYGEDGLPRNALYGDGAPIEPEALEAIRAAYQAEESAFRWEEGDLLMVDNVLAAHGHRPFSGPRKIVVGMASPGGTGAGGQ